MKKGFGNSSAEIAEYAENTFKPLDEALKNTLLRSEEKGLPPIHVPPMDGLHLEVIARASKAKKIVEIGVLGGYSAICLARALSEGGKLYALEISPDNAEVARENIQRAGLSSKVEILVGPAQENLKKIESEGPFDLVFIDADKAGYTAYFEWATQNLNVGGVILADNTFAFGRIADLSVSPENKPSVQALREFNSKVAEHKDFRSTILPTGEGLTMAVKLR